MRSGGCAAKACQTAFEDCRKVYKGGGTYYIMEIKEFLKITLEQNEEAIRIYGQFVIGDRRNRIKITPDKAIGTIKKIRDDGICEVELL